MTRLADLPPEDRPREKLQRRGPQALSDAELVAILLGKGTREHDVLAVAARVVELLGRSKEKPRLDDLQKIPGVGPAKAVLLAAALEFARRRIRPEGIRISFPADVYPLIRHYADRKQEHFLCLSLNGAREIMQTRIVSVGLADRTHVHPREVFADPIVDRAAAIIVAHNHQADDLTPSAQDLALTERLKAAGQVLGIPLLDHVVFNRRTWRSLLVPEVQ